MIIVEQKYTGATLAELEPQSAEHIQDMLTTAQHLHKGEAIPKYKRIKILQNLIGLMQEKYDFFAKLIADEGGKPFKDAKVEVTRAINGVELAIHALSNAKGYEVPTDLTEAGSGRLAFTTLEPIGIVVAVSAFNHPLNLIIHQVIPAVAAGCPVIVKPSVATPLCCLEIANLLEQAGLEQGWMQVAITSKEIAEQLVTDSRVAFFSFIGSSRVGWHLKSRLASGARCSLEHGGVAPVILGDYKDIDSFVAGLAKAGFYHAGQVCVSAQRVFVPSATLDEVVTKLTAIATAQIVGDAANSDTDIGPLISSREVVRIQEWVDEAVAEGATLVTGGKSIGEHCFEPTILVNPAPNSKVSTLEVFGPVICIYTYDNMNGAIVIANSLDVSFQSSIFTDDITTAMRTAKQLEASAVMINDYTTFRVDWMPFAGRKTSGYGIGGIEHTLADMLEHKMLVIKT